MEVFMDNEHEYINDYHGLELEPGFEEGTRDNENGILFLVEYYILKYIAGELTHADIAQFQIIVENLTAYDSEHNKIRGLYDRGAGESLGEDKDKIRKISHDNLTAISAFSKLLEKEGLAYHKQIAIHGLKWQFRYDNVYPSKPRWIFKKDNGRYGSACQWHPRDLFFYLTNGGYKIGWIFFPFFFFANILSCFTKNGETSGKLLMFVRLETGSKWSKLMKFNKKICYWILRRKYGEEFIDEIAKIYFWQRTDSPIRRRTKGNKLK